MSWHANIRSAACRVFQGTAHTNGPISHLDALWHMLSKIRRMQLLVFAFVAVKMHKGTTAVAPRYMTRWQCPSSAITRMSSGSRGGLEFPSKCNTRRCRMAGAPRSARCCAREPWHDTTGYRGSKDPLVNKNKQRGKDREKDTRTEAPPKNRLLLWLGHFAEFSGVCRPCEQLQRVLLASRSILLLLALTDLLTAGAAGVTRLLRCLGLRGGDDKRA